MKKNAGSGTSQDYDRKHQRNHITQNPRAAKDLPVMEETVEFLSHGPVTEGKHGNKPVYHEDKRETARHEHTNHFTNRAGKNGGE